MQREELFQKKRWIVRPFEEFAKKESAGGLLLLGCLVAALVWANSPWAGSYTSFWHTQVGIELGDFSLSKELLHWISDGLMVIFFFVVGLEIKREVLVGELASRRRASLPIAGALGGMIAPALIYFVINPSGEASRGWGIAMATDIALVLGVLALLGDRVPTSLKVFLTSLAIVDDIGAILVIAIFYTDHISWASLGAAGGIFITLILLNILHVRNILPYALLGTGLWLAFLESGVHATVAGVLLAMTIPARSQINAGQFLGRANYALEEFQQASKSEENVLSNEGLVTAVQSVESACESVQTPMQRLEHILLPWTTFFIMPVFALANAGVEVGGNFTSLLTSPVTVGVFLGLVVGKQLGIVLAAWLSVKSGAASLPRETGWPHIYSMAWLGGIGFTMSLFIASLAFDDPELLEAAKIGILGASILAGVVGFTLGRLTLAERASPEPRHSYL